MRQGRVVELSETIALGSAQLSLELKLSMADSIILYTARHFGARFWTQDAHFEAIEGVYYQPKVKQPTI